MQTVGYVVDGYDISIRSTPSSFNVTWAMWKKNCILTGQAMKLCLSVCIQAPQCCVVRFVFTATLCVPKGCQNINKLSVCIFCFFGLYDMFLLHLCRRGCWGELTKPCFIFSDHARREHWSLLQIVLCVCARYMSSGM